LKKGRCQEVLYILKCLYAKHGHAAVVSYLLEQGVKISNYVMSAVKEASQQVFTKLF
jgi:hypothetical protein